METPENSWFRPTPPRDGLISEVWHELLTVAGDELIKWLRPNSPEIKFISKCSIYNLHACITTRSAQAEEEKDFVSAADEMPSFTAEAVDDEGQEHLSNEPGGLLMHDVEITIDELSELRLEIIFRDIHRQILTAGILSHRLRTIELPHNMGMKIVKQLGKKYRKAFADILLYQLAEQVAQAGIDDEYEDASNLAAIIDAHLDMPNIRAFHAQLAGK